MTFKAGLDVKQRPLLLQLLHHLHQRQNPIILLGLRQHDPIPDWVTNIAVAKENAVVAGTKEALRFEIQATQSLSTHSSPRPSFTKRLESAVLVDVKSLNITYGDRKVSDVCCMYDRISFIIINRRYFKM